MTVIKLRDLAEEVGIPVEVDTPAGRFRIIRKNRTEWVIRRGMVSLPGNSGNTELAVLDSED